MQKENIYYTKNTNYTNYSPYGIGIHNSKHGYNGELTPNNNSNNYILGNGNRIYVSSLGIFNQLDSLNILKGGSINPYSYGNHNPINQFDSTGNSSTGFYAGNTIGIFTEVVGLIMTIPSGGVSLSISTSVAIASEISEIVATTASVTLKATDNIQASNIAGWTAMFVGLGSLGNGFLSKSMVNSADSTSSITSISRRTSAVSSLNSISSSSINPQSSISSIGSIGSIGSISSHSSTDLLLPSPLRLRGGGATHTNQVNFLEADNFIDINIPPIVEKDILIATENMDIIPFLKQDINDGEKYLSKIDSIGSRDSSLNYNQKNVLKISESYKMGEIGFSTLVSGADEMAETHLALMAINNTQNSRITNKSLLRSQA